jgi:hypothetical protein
VVGARGEGRPTAQVAEASGGPGRPLKPMAPPGRRAHGGLGGSTVTRPLARRSVTAPGQWQQRGCRRRASAEDGAHTSARRLHYPEMVARTAISGVLNRPRRGRSRLCCASCENHVYGARKCAGLPA